ncbi:4-hydroxy-3-methylbut-2-enyl diphosphate reductase [Pseudonocardia sp. TRM90224]|uniref:4-hydroxy-3-methylbut-2-enyl diphosphate reductase n=1 Tax=Pseudonocardia sp. TRM90224 TaxID=2812678 RepID=UPI001E58076E|nr:4-hydroxy-3-methylbut-2-enyl diphosphate reductase [Pseudonocardia sp. TRM90224]
MTDLVRFTPSSVFDDVGPDTAVAAVELRDRGDEPGTACRGAPLLAGELRRAGLPTVEGRVRLGEGPFTALVAGDPGSAFGIAVPADDGAAMQLTTDVMSRWLAVRAPRTILLASPRSFCAGVDRAIEVVRHAVDQLPGPVYVRKQIVHNTSVVEELEGLGVTFVDELDAVPDGATVIFSAHGVSPAVRTEARRRDLDVIDATCPLVSKVHAEARRFAARGDTVVLVGHDGHEEVEGTLGEAPESTVLVETVDDVARVEVADPSRVSYLTQTTLAIDETTAVIAALRDRFPQLREPPSDDICYATTNRQESLAAVAADADLALVVGSPNSSNSVRLVEVCRRNGPPAHLIDSASDIRSEWLRGVRTVGLTAGASAPPELVDGVVSALSGLGPITVEERTTAEELVRFDMPKGMRS